MMRGAITNKIGTSEVQLLTVSSSEGGGSLARFERRRKKI
jgi:hypothetical protein